MASTVQYSTAVVNNVAAVTTKKEGEKTAASEKEREKRDNDNMW
jgi:hypothetical protein